MDLAAADLHRESMGAIRPPKRAKLFAGILTGDGDLLHLTRRRLQKLIGEIDLESPVWPFTATDYYQAEIGPDVKRQFVTFLDLVSVERLAEIKRLTNELELKLCDELGRPHAARPVNIDPGYMTHAKLVLATTKDYSHRVYLQQGVYAEVTLHFESGQWKPWPWTYPDYAAGDYHAFFTEARDRFLAQLRG